MSDLFLQLTPDWVLRAVEAGGFDCTGHIFALHCLENRVYDLRLESGDHVVAKFYRPGRWSEEAILEEHALLRQLREAELPICAPLPFEDGKTLHTIEGIHYAVWPRTGGRSPEELDDEQVEILGRLVARIHNVGAMETAPNRLKLDSQTYGFSNLEFLERKGFLPPQWQGRYRKGVERICATYDALMEGVPTHRIHGDCHHGNLLNGREGWFFLDFDDFLEGPAAQDLWLLIPGQDEYAKQHRALFVESYQQFRDFEPRWLKLVEPLRGLRFIRYATWVARRWHDPAFPKSYPHFNTEQYWERETIDLEKQAIICEEAVSGPRPTWS